jgi:hypothetical protein
MTSTSGRRNRARPHRLRHLLLALAFVVGVTAVPLAVAAPAQAAACSTTTAASSCTVNATTTVTAGTLGLETSSNLYWAFSDMGYDQHASGSATTLSSCTGGSSGTTCTGGTLPKLLVLDGTGAGSGWALSAYVTSGSSLPTGSVLTFNGAGSGTVGASTASPVATSPFVGTVPATTCDYGSTCTTATAATASCTHSPLGFTTCPSYGVTVPLAGGSATAQTDLYSAAASSGLGAVCFGTGTATAAGCTGVTPSTFFNLGVKGNTPVGSYTGAVINLTVTSGP